MAMRGKGEVRRSGRGGPRCERSADVKRRAGGASASSYSHPVRSLQKQHERCGGTKISKLLGNGAQGRNRTTDTAIFSRMLYQLSYLGAVAAGGLA
jgi:hypothetical protein